MNKDLLKLENKYNKAKYELIKARDLEYPEGTEVVCFGVQRTVTGGSLYADQVYLDGHTHSGFSHITKVEDLS